MNAVFGCAWSKLPDVMELLLEKGRKKKWKNFSNWLGASPTMISKKVRFFLSHSTSYSISITQFIFQKETPLHLAAISGCGDSAEILCRSNVNLNQLNRQVRHNLCSKPCRKRLLCTLPVSKCMLTWDGAGLNACWNNCFFLCSD